MNSDSELDYFYLTPTLNGVVKGIEVTKFTGPITARKVFEAADEALRIRDSRIEELEEALNGVARVHRLPEPFPN